MAGRVEGKVAFITGAARGQGRSHAVRLARGRCRHHRGRHLRTNQRNSQIAPSTPDDLAETADLIKGLNRRVVTAEVDVRDYDALKSGRGRRRRAAGPAGHHRAPTPESAMAARRSTRPAKKTGMT